MMHCSSCGVLTQCLTKNTGFLLWWTGIYDPHSDCKWFLCACASWGFRKLVATVKGQCTNAANALILYLRCRFPAHELLNALGVIYPQYWRAAESESMFQMHLNTKNSVFRLPKQRTKDGRWVDAPLDGHILAASFLLTMFHNSEALLVEKNNVNPVTNLWQKVAASSIPFHNLSKFMKLAEMAMVVILGSVEDERTFSDLTFMKNRL